MRRMRKWIIAGGATLAGLLVVVIVLLGVLIGQNSAAATRERYDRARETCEAEIGRPSMDNLDEYAECAERLLP